MAIRPEPVNDSLFRATLSRFAMTTMFSSCISHRLEEDLLQLGLFRAEFVDAQELDELAQHLRITYIRWAEQALE